MAAPTFVNSGTRASTSFGTSLAPGLPASRVNGNLLVMVGFHGATSWSPTTPSGWTLLTNKTTLICVFIWYRIVDGTETTPSITWTGATSAHAYILQYTGNLGGSSWIGANLKSESASPTTTMTHSGITTTSDNSLVVAYASNSGATFSSGSPPAGYTSEFANANDEVADVTEATKGSSSPAISQTVVSSNWVIWEYEILSQLPNNPKTFLSNPMVG